jgi:hypothetical protein
MKRVNGCMLQRAQETIQYALGFDLPEDTPAPRRLRLETAIRLLQARCLSFETFHEHLPSISGRLEQYYDNIGCTIPRPDRPAPTREWTDQLVRCCRCQVSHSPVSLVCTPILGVSTPTPTATHAAAHVPQRTDAATAPATRNEAHMASAPARSAATWVQTSMDYVRSQLAVQRADTEAAAAAPATRRPFRTAVWVHPSVHDGRATNRPLRVDTDGAFADLDHDTEEDRSARAEATRRGPLPMPDLAN